MGEMLQAGAVNYFQSLSAAEVKKIADAIGKDANAGAGADQKTTPEAEAARAALHAIVGCAGAAASSAACSAGALGAAAGSVINSLLGGDPKSMSPQEQEDRRNLVSSLVEGIAIATGQNLAAATSSAITETENNYLRPAELVQYFDAKERLKNCASSDVSCKQAAQAEISRLEAISRERNLELAGHCEGKTGCADLLDTLFGDLGALNQFAIGISGENAAVVSEQIKEAQKKYDDTLLVVEGLAATELGSGFQNISDDELISGGYLTAAQVVDLRKLDTDTKLNLLQRVVDYLVAALNRKLPLCVDIRR